MKKFLYYKYIQRANDSLTNDPLYKEIIDNKTEEEYDEIKEIKRNLKRRKKTKKP